MQTKRKNQNELYTSVSQLVSYCPLCDVSFYPEAVVVISEDRKIQLLHATCNHCLSSVVILLLNNEWGVSSVGLVTDLTGEDVARFKDSASVSCNDVINLHTLVTRSEPFFAAL